eukprot:scaffold7006_cov174-Skeletonema_marinoi.AAC.25
MEQRSNYASFNDDKSDEECAGGTGQQAAQAMQYREGCTNAAVKEGVRWGHEAKLFMNNAPVITAPIKQIEG